jgi:hypothetical protein
VDAADIAKRLGQAQREQVARERSTALEPTLPRVVIDASGAPGAAVTLDDQPIQSGAFGTPVPLDPGDHSVRATAPGKKPFVESFSVQASSAQRTIHILALAEDEGSPPLRARGETASPPEREASTSGGVSSQRTWAWVVGGAGVAAVGVGAFFGVSAFSDRQQVESQCSKAGLCTASGDQAKSSLSTAETVSTIATLGGVAAMGLGVFLWLSGAPRDPSPKRAAAAVRMGPDFGGRGVRVELQW